MICEKCGKSNISNLSECAYCGAEMPKTTGGGGFADILSYNAADGVVPSPVRPEMHKDEKEKSSEGISELEMQKLMKKSDNIMKSTKINSLFGLVAIGLSLLILISSIIFGIVTINTVKGYKEETMKQIEEINTSMDKRITQIEEIISEIENKNDTEDNNTSGTNNEDTANKNAPENQDNEDNGNRNTGNNDVPNPSSPPRADAEGNIN